MDMPRILADLPVIDKIRLCSGEDANHTRAFPDYELPALTASDGAHGLTLAEPGCDPRPEVCFPAPGTAACSWDAELLEEIGQALGDQAKGEGVDMLLAPGLELKRNPLGGGNFERLSEDPVLSGKLAAAWVRGVESRGVAACVGRLGDASQATGRYTVDSVVDERALRELYLRGFEIAVKEGRPSAVFCAPNKLGGTRCAESAGLLTAILREDWGFEGAVLADAAALGDRMAAFEAGCDLFLPGGSASGEAAVEKAVIEDPFRRKAIDRAAERVVKLLQRAKGERAEPDRQAQHQLSRRAAAESAVLLKNRGKILPLQETDKLALIGALAKEPRIQGAGCGRVKPWKHPGVTALCPELPYVPGCLPDGSSDKALLKEAAEAAKEAEIAVVFVGLTDAEEAAGFERENMDLPEGQNKLVETVAAANPNTVVVLLSGSPVKLPWEDQVKAILYLGLPGEGGAEAAVDLLFGRQNPCGKLAESWPLRYGDCPSSGFFARSKQLAPCREGLFLGYRYYQSAEKPVRYPFGHGLSYTAFSYDRLKLSGDSVSLRVTNTGKRPGAEVVQLYLAPPRSAAYRPALELKAFQKVFLQPRQSAELCFTLTERDFAVWRRGGWLVPAGRYTVLVGGSSAELPLSAVIERAGVPWATPGLPLWYGLLRGKPTRSDFEALLGRQLRAEAPQKGSYSLDNSLDELRAHSPVMKLLAGRVESELKKSPAGKRGKDDPDYRSLHAETLDAPLSSLVSRGELKQNTAQAALALANGHVGDGLKLLIQKEQ